MRGVEIIISQSFFAIPNIPGILPRHHILVDTSLAKGLWTYTSEKKLRTVISAVISWTLSDEIIVIRS